MDLEIIKADKGAGRRPAARAAKVELEIILEQHGDWVRSHGRAGRQADLSRLNLEGADLTDTNLRSALLNETVLKGADLLLTDLHGASLLQANLQGANLLGARLREANLQGANLEGATGLLAAELAGTNLTFAKLPAEVATAEDLKYVSRRGRHAKWLISLLLLLNALACWRILSVSDAQILRDASLLPFPVLRSGLPVVQFFLLCPVLIGAFYLWLHVYLQRFWEATAALPAIFENGRRLDDSLPWLVSWPARNYFQWLRARRSSLAGVEKAICIVLLYWVAPATMLLFWGRYLTLQDLRGTILHVLLIAAAMAAAIHFPRSAARAFRGDDHGSASKSVVPADSPRSAAATADAILAEALAQPALSGNLTAGSDAGPRENTLGASHIDSPKKRRPGRVRRRIRIPVSAGFGLILCLLSIGTIGGAPHGGNPAQGIGSGGPQTWAADALWLIGYVPYAQVNEAEISRKPAGWTGSDAEISHIQGASLNGLRLRYMQAYAAFLVKARLRQADLSYAYLSEADLRQANLRQANLRSAMLDQAKLNGAIMQSANLEKANLIRAELGKAELSFASLAGALLQDAKLDGAILYGADLRGASLERASLEQADLRQAQLEGANLKMSDLREAYLSTAKMAGVVLEGSQLGGAILMGADLRRADISNGNFQGAVLSGADLSGADLRNADLRGVVGLTAAQLCAATNARQAQLDDALATDLGAQCANR